jgi:hypothetical protein
MIWDIDLIFGMRVYNHKLQINFEIRSGWMIFSQLITIGLWNLVIKNKNIAMEESIIKKNCSTTCINKYFVLFQGYRKDNKLDVSERHECDRREY